MNAEHEYAMINMAPSRRRKLKAIPHNARLGKAISMTNDIDQDGVVDFVVGSPGGFYGLKIPYGSSWRIFSVLHQAFTKKICYIEWNYKNQGFISSLFQI